MVPSSRLVSATYRLIRLKKTDQVSRVDRWNTSALFAFLDALQSLKIFTAHLVVLAVFLGTNFAVNSAIT